MAVTFQLGVKTDLIEYRYSYPWLFKLLAKEGVKRVQLASFFELYQLPDAFFEQLRRQADEAGVIIDSVFTAHRELGGFFREEPGFEAVARRNYERLIEVGAMLGATSVGSNPGSVMRDQPQLKRRGVQCYLRHMKELMAFARDRGVRWLTIGPMSCLAEPPTLPVETRDMARELSDYHEANPETTSRVGYCVDIARRYADRDGNVVWESLQLLKAAVPWLVELHLKNTDAAYEATFGFAPQERRRGVIEIDPVRKLLDEHADALPVDALGCYLDIAGPPLGRDASDARVESVLRQSLRFLKAAVLDDPAAKAQLAAEHEADGSTDGPGGLRPAAGRAATSDTAAQARDDAGPGRFAAGAFATYDGPKLATAPILIAPPMAYADQLHLLDHARLLEAAGVHLLHMDLCDCPLAGDPSISPTQLRQLADHTKTPFDVHLRVTETDRSVDWIGDLAQQRGAKDWRVAVHVEGSTDLDRSLALIGERGMKAGAALHPHTPVEALRYVLDRLDYVLIVTGVADGSLAPSALRKIADMRKLLDHEGRRLPIEVDGHVSFEHIPSMVSAGADILVTGPASLLSRSRPLAENVQHVNDAAARGYVQRSAAQGGGVIV